MPYKSKAQAAYFHTNVGKKGITPKVVEEFDETSKGMKLPKKMKKVGGSKEDRMFVKHMGRNG